MLCDIPIDILEKHILCGLSVKTLLQLRSVCKSLNAIITAPRFISMHANWSAKYQTGYLINHSGCQISHIQDKYFDFLEKLEFPFENIKFHLVGSCDGLLCLTKHYRKRSEKFPTTFIWNPSIRLVKELLPPEFIICNPNIVSYDDCVSGFGFDSLTNDYKVFHSFIAKFSTINKDHDDFVVINVVHSLKTDPDSWRVIETDEDYYYYDDDYDDDYYDDYESRYPTLYTGFCTSFNGAFYWIPTTKYEYFTPKLIMWFDFFDETIQSTSLPIAVTKNHEIVLSIGSLKNSLVVFVSDAPPGKGPCKISAWVMMKKDDETTTWVHQFSVTESQIGWPLDFGLNGETLFWKFHFKKNSKWSSRFYVHDNVKQRTKELATHIHEDSCVKRHRHCRPVRETFTYSESLLLLGLGKGVGINRY